MQELIKELEQCLLVEKSKQDIKKITKLKEEIINKYLEKYKIFYLGKISSNNQYLDLIEYNNEININEFDFIIPVKDKKLISLINRFNDINSVMDSGINNYIKNIQLIYKKIYELEGIILKFL